MDNLGRDLEKRDRPLLVTGSTGYLGGRVMESATAQGLAVVGTSRTARLECDMTSAEDVEALLDGVDPSAILHCACHVPSTSADYDDEAAAARSLEMCRLLAERARCPIVLASSMTVYGPSPRVPAREDSVAPGSAYARAKLAAEALLAGRNMRGDVALRLPGLFGPPRRGGALYNAAVAFLSGEAFALEGSPTIWAGLDVRDAAALMLRAAARRAALDFAICNVGYEGRSSITSVIGQVATLCGVDWHPARPAPEFAFDLTRMHQTLGGPDAKFEQRLADLVTDASKHLHQAVVT